MADLVRLNRMDIEVILTLNLPESLSFDPDQLPFHFEIIRNAMPKGFSANHNAAFARSHGRNFVILNPDIRLHHDPFDILLSLLASSPNTICAPQIDNEQSEIEDSARSFPTPFFLVKKLGRKIFGKPPPADAVPAAQDVLMPDWVAGMFMVVPRAIYARLRGLDERYHLYYEDVDFCARARLAGCQVLVSKQARATHHAQRDSHRKLRYLAWHLASAMKFFTSSAYMRIRFNTMVAHGIHNAVLPAWVFSWAENRRRAGLGGVHRLVPNRRWMAGPVFNERRRY